MLEKSGSSNEMEPPGKLPPRTQQRTAVQAARQNPPLRVFDLPLENNRYSAGSEDALPLERSVSGLRIFRKRFYPGTTRSQWNDWKWQMRNRIRTLEELSSILRLSPEETDALNFGNSTLPACITPYYASLLELDDPNQALRKTVVPVRDEHRTSACETLDPLHEEKDSPVPGIVHRYPDRVLFLVTDTCAAHCRYCTRSRMVGKAHSRPSNVEVWRKGLDYIASNSSVRDVLLSGGDPLTLGDDVLGELLSALRRIPHVEIVRIGTKAPVVLPQRITPALIRVLRRAHPLWMNIHFTHPDEITPESRMACLRLADAGIPLGSQTVLLKGVNDDVAVLKRLFHLLLQVRVRPYYLYQCDPIQGSGHFRTPVEKGLEIIRGLRGHTTGFAVPTYVIDAPGGGGKIPILPDAVVGYDRGHILLKNYEGGIYGYPDSSSKGTKPATRFEPCETAPGDGFSR